jgi:hypothetical protein
MLSQFKVFKQTCIQSVQLLGNMNMVVVFKSEVLDSNISWDDNPPDGFDDAVKDDVLKPDNLDAETVVRTQRKKTPSKRYSNAFVKDEPKAEGNPVKVQKRRKADKPKVAVPKVR